MVFEVCVSNGRVSVVVRSGLEQPAATKLAAQLQGVVDATGDSHVVFFIQPQEDSNG